METAKPGWYFYVECANPECREDIITGEAPVQDLNQPLRVRGTTVTCPHCSTKHTYPATQVLYGVVPKDNG